MDLDRLRILGRTALPVVAVLSIVLGLGLTLAVAGDTLGFDFLAYHQAAVRVLDGRPLYDMSFTGTGGFGLFYYPPTFAPMLLPFGLLSASAATWTWIAISIVAFLVGVAILPVTRSIRWWIVLTAGWSWPFVYAVKLGQVGPVLFFAFAVGWRWIDEPIRLGLSGAVGAAIKLQPGLVLVWALLTRRGAAVLVGGLTLVGLAGLALAISGAVAWGDFVTLLRTVTDPITTGHNFTPGAVGYQLGLSLEAAAALQVISTVGVVAVFMVAILRATDEASYLVALIASQLVSPILWDHYAILLLLPVAYLASAGWWWAFLIPIVTAWPLIDVTPPVAYPAVFWIALVATLVVGWRARQRDSAGLRLAAAAA